MHEDNHIVRGAAGEDIGVIVKSAAVKLPRAASSRKVGTACVSTDLVRDKPSRIGIGEVKVEQRLSGGVRIGNREGVGCVLVPPPTTADGLKDALAVGGTCPNAEDAQKAASARIARKTRGVVIPTIRTLMFWAGAPTGKNERPPQF
jgi:hypothetical protein